MVVFCKKGEPAFPVLGTGPGEEPESILLIVFVDLAERNLLHELANTFYLRIG
jgi:hypothetical protein